jgi:hypothetical protein
MATTQQVFFPPYGTWQAAGHIVGSVDGRSSRYDQVNSSDDRHHHRAQSDQRSRHATYTPDGPPRPLLSTSADVVVVERMPSVDERMGGTGEYPVHVGITTSSWIPTMPLPDDDSQYRPPRRIHQVQLHPYLLLVIPGLAAPQQQHVHEVVAKPVATLARLAEYINEARRWVFCRFLPLRSTLRLPHRTRTNGRHQRASWKLGWDRYGRYPPSGTSLARPGLPPFPTCQFDVPRRTARRDPPTW